MKLFLKIYSVIYALFCLYCFTVGCEKYHMKGEFEINFLGYVLLLQAALAVAVLIKYRIRGVLFFLAFPIFYVLVIVVALSLGGLFGLPDRKSFILYAIINYPLLLIGSFAYNAKLKNDNHTNTLQS